MRKQLLFTTSSTTAMVIMLTIASLSYAASGATLTVTSTANSGAGSLRAAVALAAPTGDTIQFNLPGCPCVINIGTEIEISAKQLAIVGPGAAQLTLDGGGSERIFRVRRLANADADLSISGLTLTNGATPNDGGAAIYVQGGRLTLSRTVVVGNTTTGVADTAGGAILVDFGGSLHVFDSTFTNNVGSETGGAIGSRSNGATGLVDRILIQNCTFTGNRSRFGGAIGIVDTTQLTGINNTINGNTAESDGGGVRNDGGSMVLTRGSISSNSVSGRQSLGGGVYNSGTMSLSRVSIASNTADGYGGGIYNTGKLTIGETGIVANQAPIAGVGIFNLNGGDIKISSSTISGNRNLQAIGGGIASLGTVTLENSTISGNEALRGGALVLSDQQLAGLTSGTAVFSSSTVVLNNAVDRDGGISGGAGADKLSLQNSIIALNSAPTFPDIGTVGTSLGHNLIGQIRTNFGFVDGEKNDIVGNDNAPIDPLIAPLANNGGPTQTHALLPASPAIDRGGASLGLVTDQRGNARFVDTTTVPNPPGGSLGDIGAFEYSVATAANTSQLFGLVSTSKTQGLRGAVVVLVDGDGNVRSARTSELGSFRFTDLVAGETYALFIRSKRYRFAPQLVTINADSTELNVSAVDSPLAAKPKR